MAAPHGVQVTGAMGERYDSVLTPEALELLAELHRTFDGRRLELLGPARSATPSWPPAARWTSWPRPRTSARTSWRVAAARARPGRPPGRDHRPDRPQDDDQRAQLRRQGVARRLRGRQHPAVGERRRGPAQPARRHRPARSTSPRPEGKSYALERRRAGHDRRPPARLAPAGEAHPRRRRADVGQRWSTSRSTSSTARQRQIDAGKGPYFYLPKMESHLEARLWNDVFVLRAGRAGHPARHDPGHRADRDLPGGVRDGGDPLRAARALRRA